MGKIVCEVCGAAYPETSSRCPVCGSVCYSTPEPVVDVVETEQEQPRPAPKRNTTPNQNRRKKRGKKNAKRVQLIAICTGVLILLVLLIALLVSSCNAGAEYTPTEPATEPTTAPTQPPLNIPCTDIILNMPAITLAELGQQANIGAVAMPEGTTDDIFYASSDPMVVTVDENGELTAVAIGTAEITVTCGDITKICTVTCDWEEIIEQPTLPPEPLVLNRSDITFSKKGETWQLYSGPIDISLITFSSDNDKVVTFVDGVVTAVNRGTVKVYAEIGDQKVSCIIRCAFPADTTDEGNGGVEEDNGTSDTVTYEVHSMYGKLLQDDDGMYDVTIPTGSSLKLYLKGSNGAIIPMDWTASTEGVVTIDGTKITGVARGSTTITATYGGTEYKCIVRIN